MFNCIYIEIGASNNGQESLINCGDKYISNHIFHHLKVNPLFNKLIQCNINCYLDCALGLFFWGLYDFFTSKQNNSILNSCFELTLTVAVIILNYWKKNAHSSNNLYILRYKILYKIWRKSISTILNGNVSNNFNIFNADVHEFFRFWTL